jgi:hypothetical protein
LPVAGNGERALSASEYFALSGRIIVGRVCDSEARRDRRRAIGLGKHFGDELPAS